MRLRVAEIKVARDSNVLTGSLDRLQLSDEYDALRSISPGLGDLQ